MITALNLRDIMTIFIPWFKECRDIAKYHLKDPYPHRPNGSRAEAFWRTGLSDHASGFRPADPAYAQYYRAVEQNMILLLSDKGSLRLILTLIIDSRQMQ